MFVFNVFANLHKNFTFIFIILAEIGIQFCLVQYGGLIFNCVKGGLTIEQWIICVIIASSSMVISLLLKCTRIEKMFQINYVSKIKSFLCRGRSNLEEDQLVEMGVNSDDYIG